MSAIETNKRVIERYIEEAWNKGNVAVLDEIIAPHYINHSPGVPGPRPGPEGLKPIILGLRSAFPDLRFVVHDMLVTEEKVALRCTMHGTHRGELFGMPPTGRRIQVSQMQIEHLQDGKIVEHWRQSDDLGMMRQLGLVHEDA
jgi:steroid delta-isomerase-like uncharacterized protein